MVTLEQVRLLETKVIRAVEYVERISRENSQLQGKLDSYQRRIDELEVLIQQFREDQGRIEEGILAALERLNKFEDAIEKSIADPSSPPPEPRVPPRRPEKPAPRGEGAPASAGPGVKTIPEREPEAPPSLMIDESALDEGVLNGSTLDEGVLNENTLMSESALALMDENDENNGDSGGDDGDGFSGENPAAGELDIF
ncbi:MAG: cell division protein ZapB [Treponema sp.]|jgi:TolA-binding protein|nr:cell division protein ZapB [Treponema sp.]